MLHGCIAEIDGEYYFFRNDGTLLIEDETCLIESSDGNAFWMIIFITVMTLLRFVVRRMWMIRSICLTTRQDGFCVIGSF